MTSKLSRLVLPLAILALVSACGAPPKRVDWRWPERTSYETTPARGDKFFLSVEDFEEDAELFEGLRDGLASKLTSEYGLEQVSSPQEAEYACYVYIRYFNTNPGADGGDALLLSQSDVLGGQKGWLKRDGTEIDEPPQVKEVPPMGTGKEWDLLVDIAVGEKTESGIKLRSGRLLGSVKGSREDALWLLRRGELPPPPMKPVEGQVVQAAAPRPTPPDHLVDTLSKGILRVP